MSLPELKIDKLTAKLPIIQGGMAVRISTGALAGVQDLYRHFDTADRLLYIGISGRLPVRETEHESGSRWWELIARSAAEPFETRLAVVTAERIAIQQTFQNRPGLMDRLVEMTDQELKEWMDENFPHTKPRPPDGGTKLLMMPGRAAAPDYDTGSQEVRRGRRRG